LSYAPTIINPAIQPIVPHCRSFKEKL